MKRNSDRHAVNVLVTEAILVTDFAGITRQLVGRHPACARMSQQYQKDRR
jgi:hypothetical protein